MRWINLSGGDELSLELEPCLKLSLSSKWRARDIRMNLLKLISSSLFQGKKGKRKKYGANAPQLHPIRCSIDFCVMLCNEQAKNQKIRRKCATVAPYLAGRRK